MRFRWIFVLFLLIVSCSKPQEETSLVDGGLVKFVNQKYGFSFDYPKEWGQTTKDLPDKWAISNGKNDTIIFVVSKTDQGNIMDIGRAQALSDLYPDLDPSDISENDMKQIIEMVKVQTFNQNEWFTYGMRFENLGVDSIISGTLCDGNEVLFVLVTDFNSFEMLKSTYNDILNSFNC